MGNDEDVDEGWRTSRSGWTHDPGGWSSHSAGGPESRRRRYRSETKHKTRSVLRKIIRVDSSALQYFFAAGPDKVRAWTAVRKGTKAPQAVGKIHTGFQKGFIMAEVMRFQGFKEEGSENAVKAAPNAPKKK